jgi:hypothetical protein
MLIEGTPEIAEVVDFGEEEENKNNEAKNDVDAKIYYSHYNAFLNNSLEERSLIRFYSKNYTSYHKKLSSPPPELWS